MNLIHRCRVFEGMYGVVVPQVSMKDGHRKLWCALMDQHLLVSR